MGSSFSGIVGRDNLLGVPSWTKSVRPSSLLLRFFLNRERREEKARHINVSIFHIKILTLKGITEVSGRYSAVFAMGLINCFDA